MLNAYTDDKENQYYNAGYLTHNMAETELSSTRAQAQQGLEGDFALPQNGFEEYAFSYSSEAEMNEKRLGNTFSTIYPDTKKQGEYLQKHYGVIDDELTKKLKAINDYMETQNTCKYYLWLKDNSYKYGFILRYPDGKQSITRKEYMPWLFRYVGVDVATQMYNENLCFEEYYAKYYNPVVNDNNYSIDPESTQKIISQ